MPGDSALLLLLLGSGNYFKLNGLVFFIYGRCLSGLSRCLCCSTYFLLLSSWIVSFACHHFSYFFSFSFFFFKRNNSILTIFKSFKSAILSLL